MLASDLASKAIRPAGASSPRSSRLRTRSTFTRLHVLPGLRGVNRMVYRSASTLFRIPSIQPKRNAYDLEDVPDEIKNSMKFIYVETVDDVLEAALEPARIEVKKKTVKHKQTKPINKSKPNGKNHGGRR